MKTLFGEIIDAGIQREGDRVHGGAAGQEVFEYGMPIEKSGSVSFAARAFDGVAPSDPRICHITAFDIFFERWDNDSSANVLQLFMSGESKSFFSLNMVYFSGSNRIHVRLRNSVYSRQDSIVARVPLGEWMRLQVEYYGYSGVARIYLNGAFLGEYSTNFDLTSTASFSALSFFATSNAGFKLYLNNLVAVSVAKELKNSDSVPICLDGYPVYTFGNITEPSLAEGVSSKCGTRSVISVAPSPTDGEESVLSFEVRKNSTVRVNSVLYPFSSETMVLVKPGGVKTVENPLQCYYVSFKVREGELRDALMKLPDCVEPSSAGRYRELFQKLMTFYSSEKPHDVLMIESLMLEMFHRLISEYGETVGEGEDGSDAKEAALAAKLDAVTRYVRSNLSRRLLLEDVASFVGYSPAYFHKIFKRATGVTLGDYIRNERIKRAVHLMATTSHTLTQIAYECGFSSQSYFSAAFRQMMGVTPRHYVERHEK